MHRRSFLTLLGCAAAAWPMAARGQRVPTIGYLTSTTRETAATGIALLTKSLTEFGYDVGQNLHIEYRFADDHYERLPALAADLVKSRVQVIIVSAAVNAVIAAKEATKSVPIVFNVGSDPVQMGLVNSLSRPGGNATGVTQLGRELLAKQLEMLRELIPGAGSIGLVVNPNNSNTESSVNEMQVLAEAGGWRLQVVTATTEGELDQAIAELARLNVAGFLNATDVVLANSASKIVTLAARYRIPAIHPYREFVDAGGLMSYGASRAETTRVVSDYTSRILKGTKPSDLPVQQATKVELVINLKAAKAFGLTFPTALLVRADEVIE